MLRLTLLVFLSSVGRVEASHSETAVKVSEKCGQTVTLINPSTLVTLGADDDDDLEELCNVKVMTADVRDKIVIKMVKSTVEGEVPSWIKIRDWESNMDILPAYFGKDADGLVSKGNKIILRFQFGSEAYRRDSKYGRPKWVVLLTQFRPLQSRQQCESPRTNKRHKRSAKRNKFHDGNNNNNDDDDDDNTFYYTWYMSSSMTYPNYWLEYFDMDDYLLYYNDFDDYEYIPNMFYSNHHGNVHAIHDENNNEWTSRRDRRHKRKEDRRNERMAKRHDQFLETGKWSDESDWSDGFDGYDWIHWEWTGDRDEEMFEENSYVNEDDHDENRQEESDHDAEYDKWLHADDHVLGGERNFHCDRNRCMDYILKCNREANCDDGTDETNCGLHLPKWSYYAMAGGGVVLFVVVVVVVVACCCRRRKEPDTSESDEPQDEAEQGREKSNIHALYSLPCAGAVGGVGYPQEMTSSSIGEPPSYPSVVSNPRGYPDMEADKGNHAADPPPGYPTELADAPPEYRSHPASMKDFEVEYGDPDHVQYL